MWPFYIYVHVVDRNCPSVDVVCEREYLYGVLVMLWLPPASKGGRCHPQHLVEDCNSCRHPFMRLDFNIALSYSPILACHGVHGFMYTHLLNGLASTQDPRDIVPGSDSAKSYHLDPHRLQ